MMTTTFVDSSVRNEPRHGLVWAMVLHGLIYRGGVRPFHLPGINPPLEH